jgi:hypothetical protein
MQDARIAAEMKDPQLQRCDFEAGYLAALAAREEPPLFGGSYNDASERRKHASDALKGFHEETDDPTGRLALGDRVLAAIREAEELPGDAQRPEAAAQLVRDTEREHEGCPFGICVRREGHAGPHRDHLTFAELAEREHEPADDEAKGDARS